MTDSYGYVASIGYFTPAQIKDSAWEFRRLQEAAGSLCKGFRHAIRRDVQWFETRPGSGRSCARVTYTFRCMAAADFGRAIPADALEATRAAVMARPVDTPLEADCGEKDANKRHRLKQQAPARQSDAQSNQQ